MSIPIVSSSCQSAKMVDWLRDWRNAWLGRPAVRERLAGLPFGRGIADRHARRLFGIVSGFAQSQMLAAAIDLGWFDRLAKGPAKAEGLIDLPPASADALCASMIALGLAERRADGRLALTVDGMVIATDPGIRAMIGHHRLLYADLADPVAALRRPGSGALAVFWPYAGRGAAADYSALMAASLGFVTDSLFKSHDFRRYRRVMDVGGGSGGFVAALARQHPQLALTLVDLPPVAALARKRLAEQGLSHIAVVSCHEDAPLPKGADAITLVRLLHDLDDIAAAALLRRVAEALPFGGRVVVAEPMRSHRTNPVTVYFAAYFIGMGSGRLRSPAEIRALLSSAGLAVEGRASSAFLLNVVVARKTNRPA